MSMPGKFIKVLVPTYTVVFISYLITIFSTIGSVDNIYFEIAIFFLFPLIFIFGIVIVVMMIIDCAKRTFPNQNQKTKWLILLALFTLYSAIIYYYYHGKNPMK